ncbi:MAG: hypothetical protein C3F13_18380 [Anaerolineales bacterium]|nr:MAG: hypothetical protein C3F13_18380 [Anaerolineales bacterium]
MKSKRGLLASVCLCLGLTVAFTLLILLGQQASRALAFSSSGNTSSTLQASLPEMRSSALEDIDLDVTFINRSPLYQAYCVEYPWDVPGQPGIPFLCPGTEEDQRWPEQGEIVTFTAHIINKGTAPSPTFDYAWYIDSVEVASGSLPGLAPAQEITTTYKWPWGHEMSADGQQALGDHNVAFSADPDDLISESFESNNTLEDPTNAMSFHFFFTPAMYTAYNEPVDPQWPRSAEDWIQKQMTMMNWDFKYSTYPVAPDGATLRVRIDKIALSNAYPTIPGPDGGWFINADYRHGASGWYDPATDIDWALIHEMSHQVAIIDLYAIGAEPSALKVNDHLGNPVNFSFAWPRPDLMGGGDIWPHTEWYRYSSHVVGGASTYKGYRNGYYGAYLFDIPLENYFLVLDNQGNPAQDVKVKLWQRNGTPDWTGQSAFDDPPDINGTTDSSGRFLLTNRTVNGGTTTANGHVLHDNPFGVVDIIGSQNLFLVSLKQEDHEEFRWLDITEFNLAYWMGDTISHTFVISSHVPPLLAPQAPRVSNPQVQGDGAKICWQPGTPPVPSSYRVYRASAPMFAYEQIAQVTDSMCFEDNYPAGSYGSKVYAVTAVSSTGTESGFSNFAWAPTLTNPTSVAITSDGGRYILDPRNGYALIRQDGGGTFQKYVGSVHFHLEYSQYMAMTASNHLLFSHPGDVYTDTHSVRTAELDGTPLLEFGEQGSGPGQFETPSGVAGWGEACSFGGPYEDDEHTSLLLHFDGSYNGEQGEPGAHQGTSFDTGRYGQGVLIDDTDTLTYLVEGNINHQQGAIEFWIQPIWDGDDGGNHTLFWWGEGDNIFHLRKDPISNLVFDRFFGGGSCGAPHNVADWRNGEWHHLAITWDGPEMALFEDGLQVAQTVCGGTANPTGDSFAIGTDLSSEQTIDAIIDEFRISDTPRLGDSLSCGRILVADSGNNRLQAFNSQGDFLSEFGTYGNGAGQFNDPQGLAVDQSGRVFVVDRGNNRLVILGFNGETFSYLGSITSGFNAPTSVSFGPPGILAVADTGNNRIVVLDLDGNFLAAYDQPNDGYSGFFNAPRGVAVDQDGDLVIADTGNGRVVTVRSIKYIWLPAVLRMNK